MSPALLGGILGAVICIAAIAWSIVKSKQETPGLIADEDMK